MMDYAPYDSGIIADFSCIPKSNDYRSDFLTGVDVTDSYGVMDGPTNPVHQVAWVYACISTLARNTARPPMCMSHGQADGTRAFNGYKKVRIGNRNRRVCGKHHTKAMPGDQVSSHPLLDLLARPNAAQGWAAFCEQTIGVLYATGRAHWLFDDMVGRRPLSMWCLPGTAMTPKYTNGHIRKLSHWELKGADGSITIVHLDEVITLTLSDPYNPFVGMSPIEPASMAISSYYNADRHIAMTFSNGAEPGGVLQTDQPLTAEAAEVIRSSFEQRHRGSMNAGRIAILHGGLKWQATASNMVNMQAAELARMKREDICTVFSTPPSVVGFIGTTGDSTSLTSVELERFWIDTVSPLIEYIAETIQEFLLPLYVDSDTYEVWADFEQVPVLQRLRQSLVAVAEKLHGLGKSMRSIDEWLNLGLPQDVGDDIAWMGSNKLPIELPVMTDQSRSQQTSEDSHNRELKISDEAANRLWQAWIRSWQPRAKQLATIFTREAEAQIRIAKRSLRAILPAEKNAHNRDANEQIVGSVLVDVFDDPDAIDKFRSRISAHINEGARLGAAQGVDEADLPQAQSEELSLRLEHDPRITEAVRDNSIRFSETVNGATRSQMRQALSDGLAAGESFNQLADRISQLVEGSRARSVGIANNAVAEILSMSQREGRKAAGMTHEIWIYSRGPGDRREAHKAAEAKYTAEPKPIDEKWIINGVEMEYPRDPKAPASERANCQCMAVGKRTFNAAINGNQINYRSI